MKAIKKIFAAAAFGTVGFIAGGFIAGTDWADQTLSQCGQDYNNALKTREIKKFDDLYMSEYPCSTPMINGLFTAMAGSLGLGIAGAVAGATLVARNKKSGPNPS